MGGRGDEHRAGGAVGRCAKRVTSDGACAVVVAEAGASNPVGHRTGETGGAGPGGEDAALLEDFNYLPEAIRVEDVRIAAASAAFDESTGNKGYFFDFRDGSRVHVSKYREYSMEEKEDMQCAEEEHAERMFVYKRPSVRQMPRYWRWR